MTVTGVTVPPYWTNCQRQSRQDARALRLCSIPSAVAVTWETALFTWFAAIFASVRVGFLTSDMETSWVLSAAELGSGCWGLGTGG
jgi:hypothetical protein